MKHQCRDTGDAFSHPARQMIECDCNTHKGCRLQIQYETTLSKTLCMLYLVMLKAVKQYVQIKGRHVVANQHIWVQAVQPVHQVAEQSTFTGLDRQHAAAVTTSQLTLIALFDRLLEACKSMT